MSAGAREALEKAQEAADDAYENWIAQVHLDGSSWAALGYDDSHGSEFDLDSLKYLIKDNWGKIAAVGAAFGIPLGVADSGAFKGILGLLGNFWPF